MTPAPPDILESLLVATHRLTRLAAQATGSRVPSATWRTLSILETDGPMRIGELAAASRTTQPGMTRLLREMVADEYVSRIADVDDSRAWLIRITDTGRRELAAWRQTLANRLAPQFDELSPDDWQALARAAAILARRTEAHDEVVA